MRRKVINLMLGVFVLLAFGLTGCGGGSGGTPSSDITTDPSVAKYAGTYSRTYSGDAVGTWDVTVDNAGKVSGTSTGSAGVISGAVNGSGTMSMTFGTASVGAIFSGTVDNSGKSTGTWVRASNGYSGTFTGQRKEGAIISSTTGVTFKHRVTISGTGLGNVGVTVSTIGLTPEISTSTDSNGYFTLSGVPKNTPFSIKFTKVTYANLYTAQRSLTSDIDNSSSPYSMLLSTDFANSFGTSPGTGVIASYARNNSDATAIVGAVVTATDASNVATTYTVYYFSNAGIWDATLSSTANSGRWMVKNIPSGKTVKVTANKPGFTFDTKIFVTNADSLSQNTINGTAN